MGTARKYCWKLSPANPCLEGQTGVLQLPSEANPNDSWQLFPSHPVFSPSRPSPAQSFALMQPGFLGELPQPRGSPRSGGPRWGEREGGSCRSPLCLGRSSSRILGGRVRRQLFVQPVLAHAGPALPALINHTVAASPSSLWGSCLPFPSPCLLLFPPSYPSPPHYSSPSFSLSLSPSPSPFRFPFSSAFAFSCSALPLSFPLPLPLPFPLSFPFAFLFPSYSPLLFFPFPFSCGVESGLDGTPGLCQTGTPPPIFPGSPQKRSGDWEESQTQSWQDSPGIPILSQPSQ